MYPRTVRQESIPAIQKCPGEGMRNGIQRKADFPEANFKRSVVLRLSKVQKHLKILHITNS